MVQGGERCLESGERHAKSFGVQGWEGLPYGHRSTDMVFVRRSRLTYGCAVILVIGPGQMVQAPWLDALRATLFGRLVLGQGFLWSDLVCYAAGIAIGVVAELALQVRRAV